ncbi:PE-PPE domain-containing protein [Mycolicibacterium sp.]|uniref:PE-PPE domain-containing protein n=1 Tax=Mycolicibacterium sp. TaxID=2320850 RepID=UPI003D126405
MSAVSVVATPVPLLAGNTTALVMGGTFHPLTGPRDSPAYVTGYLDNAVHRHLDPAFGTPITNAVAVVTPQEFFPIGRRTLDRSVAEGRVILHTCLATPPNCAVNTDAGVLPRAGSVAPHPGDAFRVFGYSQSAVIASLVKSDLIRTFQPGDPSVAFMLIANPMRPNGGILMRLLGWPTIPILGVSFPGASPTDSARLDDGSWAFPTVDVVRQYDGLGGDFPVRPLNLIALVNALMGYGLLHGETVDVPFARARHQGQVGDTSYRLIATDIVPLLQPFAFFVPKPILAAVDAPLRVLIEDAYERGVSPGTPTRADWRPIKNLAKLAVDLIAAIPVAVDNLIEGFGLPRVLGTDRPGPFGVGGPALPDEPAPTESALPATEPVAPQAIRVSDGGGAGDPEPDAADPVPAGDADITGNADDPGASGDEVAVTDVTDDAGITEADGADAAEEPGVAQPDDEADEAEGADDADARADPESAPAPARDAEDAAAAA